MSVALSIAGYCLLAILALLAVLNFLFTMEIRAQDQDDTRSSSRKDGHGP